MLAILLIIVSLLYVQSAPLDNEQKSESSYDTSQFDQVYDQRQNGTENFRLSFNKLFLIWTPPGSLIAAATLLDPALFESDDFKFEEKPEDVIVVKPESTTLPPLLENASETNVSKRRFRVPGFIRPFMRRYPMTHS